MPANRGENEIPLHREIRRFLEEVTLTRDLNVREELSFPALAEVHR